MSEPSGSRSPTICFDTNRLRHPANALCPPKTTILTTLSNRMFPGNLDAPPPRPAPAPRALKESTSSSRSLNHFTPPSSFRGGTAANAFCTVRDPTVTDPLATRPIIVGLDSYSDVTVAHRDIAYAIHRVAETVHTGAGASTHQEEGLVDIVDGLYSFRTIPALIAQTPDHLPSSTHLLLGIQQINDLDVKCDVHRKQRRLPLQSYDPDSDFAFDVSLQCRLAEKDLVR
jgi:hypothetical protein